MGKFNFIETGIEGLTVIEPTLYGDDRGYFMETYSQRHFAEEGNMTMTFVRVTKGEVFDVAVDLRPGSKTYGKWYGVRLSEENKKQFYIPENFAHGFLVLSDVAEFCYKCTDFYYPEFDGGIMWDDPDIGIQWPLEGIEEIKLSEKDKKHHYFKDIKRG